MERIQTKNKRGMKSMIDDVSITELHLCSECKYRIDEPDEKGWKTGCLTRGKPNPTGGPCDCNYFEGV